jgi:demethylmenaquinone methyltransferase/2-methoxy-6-polyprenyl-1,4-benzoquinol methylase
MPVTAAATAANYDRLSPWYDWLTAVERPYRALALDLLAVRPGETVLEIGCGTGQALAELARAAGSGGLAVGLDLSGGMLAQARKRFAPEETAVSLLRGNALTLPLSSASCDAVFLSFTLELLDLDQQHRLLAEVRRVLQENGRLALLSLSNHVLTPVSRLYWSLHELVPAVIDCRPLLVAPLLAAAGFTVTREEQHTLFGLPLTAVCGRPAAAR